MKKYKAEAEALIDEVGLSADRPDDLEPINAINARFEGFDVEIHQKDVRIRELESQLPLRTLKILPVISDEGSGISRVDISTALQGAARKMGKSTNAKKIKDALYIKRALEGRPFSEHADEDQDLALSQALLAVMRVLPENVPTIRVAEVVASSRPDLSTDELCQYVEQVRPAVRAKVELAQLNRDRENFIVNKEGGRIGNSPINIELALEKLGLELRFNELEQKCQLTRPDEDGKTTTCRADDGEVDKLRHEMYETFGFLPELDLLHRTVKLVAKRASFHPFKEYVDSQEPTWDGESRCETWLIKYGGAEDTPYVRAVSKIVLVATVRRTRQPGCKFDEMLILESPQGSFKSTAVKTLCPAPSLFADNFRLYQDTRRNMEQTAGKVIVEFGELRGMGERDHRDLKAYLSSTHDEARMAYGREPISVPRQFIIIGTTNDPHYLRDMTGDRRYWPVKVKAFDVARLEADRDQLWAEAAHLESQGESIRLDPSLYEAAGAEQRARRAQTPTEMLLRDAFEDFGHGKVRLKEVWQMAGVELLGKSKPSPSESQEISAVMSLLGWNLVDPITFADDRKHRAFVKGCRCEIQHSAGKTIYVKGHAEGCLG